MIKQSRTYLLVLIGIILFFSVRSQVVIQRCDVTTGWKGNWVFSIEYTDKKEGDGSLKINAQTGTSDWFRKSFSRTHTGISSSGFLLFWLYLSDASKLEGGQIEISSSGESDKLEYNWTFDKKSVTNGWNLMQLRISDANQTGGGANLDSINFFRIYQTLSGPITAKIDFVRFAPSTGIPGWPLLNVPKVDNSSLDGKVMFGYQGWFNHSDDGAGLGWVHWGSLYEPIKLSVDMFSDFPNESKIEISIDGGQTFKYSTDDNLGNTKIEGLNEGKYKVFVRHSASSPLVDMGNVNIADITASIPKQASNPFPENNATDIRLKLSPGWTIGEHTVSNYIYFGTSSNPDSMKYQVSDSFNPGDLKPNTTYYWRIDEGNGLGITKGPLWKFSTGNADGPANGVVLDYCDDICGWSSSKVNIAVFDVLGQEMKGISQEKNLDAGSHLISLPLNHLNPGTYVVKTRINHSIKSDILIVQ